MRCRRGPTITQVAHRHLRGFLLFRMQVADPSAFSQMALVMALDDGAVVWVNGIEARAGGCEGREGGAEGERGRCGHDASPSSHTPRLCIPL